MIETGIFIAKIFGIFYLVAGVGLLFNRKFYQKFMEDYSNSTVLIFFTGALALAVGLVIVLVYHGWPHNWTIIITIMGWIALIKGVWIIVFPSTVPRVMEVYLKHKSLLTVHAIATLTLGTVLTFLGFVWR